MAAAVLPALIKRGRTQLSLRQVEDNLVKVPDKTRGYGSSWDWFLGTTEGQWTTLLFIGFCLVAGGTCVWRLTPGTAAFPASTFQESLWMSYTLWADVGSQTALSAADPPICSTVAIIFSFLGFVYNLALLGLVVDVIRGRLANWKVVKNRVTVKDHVLILGWCDKTLFLLDELLAAEMCSKERRANNCCSSCCKRQKRRIVILADRPARDMSQDVVTYFQSRSYFQKKDLIGRAGSIVYRQGDMTDQAELLKVSAPQASTILLMTPSSEGDSSSGDDAVMQTLLALAALHLEYRLSGDLFAEMQNHFSIRVMNDIFPMAEGVVARHAVNRILLLRALVPPVGFTFLEMASFNRGNELHLISIPGALIGMQFGSACRLFPDGVVMGVIGPGESESSGVIDSEFAVSPASASRVSFSSREQQSPGLMPAEEYELSAFDQLVVLASKYQSACNFDLKWDSLLSRSTVEAVPPPWTDLQTTDGQLKLSPSLSDPKVILLIGCPPDLPDFLDILDGYLPSGSEVHVLSESSEESRIDGLRRHCHDSTIRLDGTSSSSSGSYFKRITVQHHFGPSTQDWAMKQLPLARADCAIILSEPYKKNEPAIAQDSRSLTSVITLRALLPKDKKNRKTKNCKVVTELIHPKSNLVVDGNDSIRKHGSFVYSTQLETGIFALASEEKIVYNTLLNILAPQQGAGHVVIAPVSCVVRGREELSYLDLHSRIMATCNGILLGWRKKDDHYPVLNPPKKDEPGTWIQESGDEFIVFLGAVTRPDTPPCHSFQEEPGFDLQPDLPIGAPMPSFQSESIEPEMSQKRVSSAHRSA